MKRSLWAMLLVLTLAACAAKTPAAAPVATTAAPAPTVSASTSDSVVATGQVVPARTVDLGFTLSGVLKEVPVKKGDQVKAGDVLAALDTPDLQSSADAADASYRSALISAELKNADSMRVRNARNGRTYFVGIPAEVAMIAQARVDQAQSVLASANALLAQNTLTAPFDGSVVALDAEAGQAVQSAQAFMTLATLDQLQVRTTDLSERDIARVKVGQTVSIFIEALNTTVSGRVTRIDPRSETVGGDVVFPVTIELDETPAGLLWGMTVEVSIQAG